MKHAALIKLMKDTNLSDEFKDAALSLEMTKAEIKGCVNTWRQILNKETVGSRQGDGAEPSWDSASSSDIIWEK